MIIFNFQFSIFKSKNRLLRRLPGGSSVNPRTPWGGGGFSLIELMISITIIGIIATIVLTNLSNSRAKAYDSKIIQQLRGFRTAADIYFGSQILPGYGPATVGCDSGIFDDFKQINGTPGVYITEGNLPLGTQTACQSSDSAYAVKATLYSGNAYWCVDSKGAFRKIDGPLDGPSLFCP